MLNFEIDFVGYTEDGLIHAKIDGVDLFVPNDMGNRHRQMIAQWEDAGGIIAPYAAPAATVEYPSLTSRQFWLAASRINVTKADVLALVDAMEDKEAAVDLRIEVSETVNFQRTNPAVDELATLLGITAEQLDSLWVWAAQF